VRVFFAVPSGGGLKRRMPRAPEPPLSRIHALTHSRRPPSSRSLVELFFKFKVSASLGGLVARKRNLDPKGKYSFRVRPTLPPPSVGGGGGGGDDGAWFFSAPNAAEFKPVGPKAAPLFLDLFGPHLQLCPAPKAGCPVSPTAERLAG